MVVAIVGELAVLSVVHRPAAERSWKSGLGRVQREDFAERMAHSFPPSAWPSACGEVARGSIYNRGGSIAAAPLCARCVAVLAGEIEPTPPTTREATKKLTPAAREVLALIDEHGEVTSRLVAQARDMTRSSAHGQLLRLCDRGLISRVGWGRYALAAEGAS